MIKNKAIWVCEIFAVLVIIILIKYYDVKNEERYNRLEETVKKTEANIAIIASSLADFIIHNSRTAPFSNDPTAGSVIVPGTGVPGAIPGIPGNGIPSDIDSSAPNNGLPLHKPGAENGAIVSYDTKFNFYVINRGKDHGVKPGDEFNVLRDGNIVGKIKIEYAQPTVSIAVALKEFTHQLLKAGDKVAKAK